MPQANQEPEKFRAHGKCERGDTQAVELLKQKRSDRVSVGLTLDTDRSNPQIAARYDPDMTRAILSDGFACDLHSA